MDGNNEFRFEAVGENEHQPSVAARAGSFGMRHCRYVIISVSSIRVAAASITQAQAPHVLLYLQTKLLSERKVRQNCEFNEPLNS